MTITVKDAGGTVRTVKTLDDLAADGGQTTIGSKADAADTSTDTTAVSGMSVWKQISKSIQAAAASLATLVASGIAVSNANGNGRALPANSAPVVLNSMTYKTVAASQTDALLGATGASGDYLDGLLIVPAATGCGAVSIKDAGGSAITVFAGGGTTALPDLRPFFVPVGAISSAGAGGWKVTTGGSVSIIAIGNFT